MPAINQLKFEICRASDDAETVAQIVRIHRQVLNQGFLSSLGDGALALLFSFAAASRSAVLMVARNGSDGRVVGFLLGTYRTAGFYQEFLRRKSIAALCVVAPKLLSFQRIVKVLETLFYPARRTVQHFPEPELLDVAVLPEFQGAGLGQSMFRAFVDELRAHGVKEFKITTGEGLVQAHRFYEKLGARLAGTLQVHRGQNTRVYVYSTS